MALHTCRTKAMTTKNDGGFYVLLERPNQLLYLCGVQMKEAITGSGFRVGEYLKGFSVFLFQCLSLGDGGVHCCLKT